MPVYRLSEKEISFPDPVLAEDNGLLAVGGDLSMERLLLAYMYGIFPWYNPEDEIMWWCPKKRFLIFPGEIHVSRSMKKYMKKHDIKLCLNRDFRDTMHRCRMKRENAEGTWITDEMEEAYYRLNEKGWAVSAEAFEDGKLAGGLYGVSIGKCFFGESMFSEKENGSKTALIALAQILEENGFLFIDCQFHTEHLESMGGRYVPWEEYNKMLEEGTHRSEW
ncbi:leucyl/phenylalanyl-tRNA--protein transferase [[Clostridium] symbiosum]|uniref:leucyl/phenylalanyl-tRNA--protein transferase n=1 Tax=Clostridium symbiosum TaxID=1512 RepID=UPI001D07F510|nr:leucyl/phenylalanyl-tRNA--protein transferase [[Clostridium] symbiosum]MCB6611185.1 leucyl/phenylalanyl-tRNA--protein transferase [[Clostridium] symbiosum]MCB6933302.1 leucyl/phenylalanyl-tRNA--protein transferase [[Clostridium] symbiosum]